MMRRCLGDRRRRSNRSAVAFSIAPENSGSFRHSVIVLQESALYLATKSQRPPTKAELKRRHDPRGKLNPASFATLLIHAVIRVSRRRQQVFSIDERFRLEIENRKIVVRVVELDSDLAGASGVFVRVVLNALYLLARALVALYLRDQFNDDLRGPVEDVLNNLALDLVFAGSLPGSRVHVRGEPAAIDLLNDAIGFTYRLEITGA